MGLLDIFKRKEESPPEPSPEEINIGSILDWFSSGFDSELSDKRSQARGLHDRLRKSFSEIEKSVQTLGKSDFESGDKTYAAANMIKNTVVRKVRVAAAGVAEAPHADWESLSGFCSAAQKTIRDMMSLSPKQSILLTRYFGREAEQVISNIKRTDAQLKDLRSFLDSDARILRLEQELIKQNTKYQEVVDKIQALEKRAKEGQENKSRLGKELGNRKKGLEDFLQGSEWGSYTAAKEEAAETDKRLAELKTRISLELGPVKRPLKKLRHAGETVPTGDMFELILQNQEYRLASALKKVLEMASSGKVSLKTKDTEKVRAVLKSLEKTIPTMKEEYQKQLKLRERARKQASQDILDKKHRLEEALERAGKGLEALESELSGLEKEKERADQQLLEIKKSLEELVSGHSGRKITINI